MKQLLFLLLFPCLCVAQYPGNGNQKITLGEQTSADGLVFRGLAADTTRKPSVDTMAYILLDTNTNIIWQYKKATSNAWLKVNLTRADTTLFNYVNTYGTQTVNGAKTFTSAVTATRFNPTASTVTGNGIYLPQSNNLGISTNGRRSLVIDSLGNIYQKGSVFYPNVDEFSFMHLFGSTFNIISAISRLGMASNLYYDGSSYKHKTNGTASMIIMDGPTGGFRFYTIASGIANSTASSNLRFQILNNGNIGIGTAQDVATEKLHVVGNARISGLAGTGNRTVLADLNGVLSAPVSSINYKENVQPLNYGLNEILQINPISFDYIDKDKWGEDRNLGFIVEDIFPIIPEVTGTIENDAMYLDMVKLIPILTKAIQEQNLLIKALEQRILILENK